MEQNIFFRNISKLYRIKTKNIPTKKYIKYFNDTTRINLWKSHGISEENVENITKSDSNFAPIFADHHVLSDINSNGHGLINNNISIPKKVNLYYSYI